jgi:dTMP kinase
MCPETELLLFFAARAQHVREVVVPALSAGKWVLCDRFSDATFAYQAAGRGLDEAFVTMVNDYSALKISPALTLLFDLPVETGLLRAGKRDIQLADPSAADRFEREKIDFHNRVRSKYLNLSRDNPDRFRVINAEKPVQDVASDVRGHVMDFIHRHS